MQGSHRYKTQPELWFKTVYINNVAGRACKAEL